MTKIEKVRERYLGYNHLPMTTRVQKGDKIEPLMAQLSEDPGSSKDGKSYDVSPTAQLVPPFKNLSLRLKVVDRRIAEIETIVLRPQANNGFGNPVAMPRRPAFYEDVPEGKRLSRTQLVSIANSYFETLQQNHGVVFAPFASTCHRLENGVATTNNNTPPATGRPDPVGIKKLGCEAQFKTGYFNFIRDRRPLVVDEQKGLVFMAGFFDHKGDIRAETLTDGRVVDPQYDTPWTWQIGEIFKIKDNKIDQVEALVLYAPYGETDTWSDRPKWLPAH